MMSRKKKIVTPSEDEVAKFGGEQPTEDAPQSSEQPGAGQAEGETAEGETTLDAEAWKEKCLRAKAELLNYQRRAEKTRVESLRYANAGLIKALLPVIDDLDRVVTSSIEHPDNAEAAIEGVKLTLDNLLKVFRSFNVTPIESEGQIFDPNEHEALMQQPSDEHPDQTVLQEAQKGYRLHDRVLRPAKVIISKATGAPDESQDQPTGEDAADSDGSADSTLDETA